MKVFSTPVYFAAVSFILFSVCAAEPTQSEIPKRPDYFPETILNDPPSRNKSGSRDHSLFLEEKILSGIRINENSNELMKYFLPSAQEVHLLRSEQKGWKRVVDLSDEEKLTINVVYYEERGETTILRGNVDFDDLSIFVLTFFNEITIGCIYIPSKINYELAGDSRGVYLREVFAENWSCGSQIKHNQK